MDTVRSYLNGIIRDVVPKSWKVEFLVNKEIIGIDNIRGRVGWGIGWKLDEQQLKVACGTTSVTVNLADPKSKDQLTQFFRYLTNKKYMEMPDCVVIERTAGEIREDDDF